MSEMTQAARWQERKAHWMKTGINPAIAGELAWQHLEGINEGPETIDQARKADGAAGPKKSWDERLDALGSLSSPSVVRNEPSWDKKCGPPPWTLGAQWPTKAGYCRECWKWWRGERPEHCAVCHQTFASETAGNAHRVGDYADGSRRCLTSLELEARGLWTDDRGTWHGSPNKHGIQKRHPRRKQD